MENFTGYKPEFIGDKLKVAVPKLNKDQSADVFSVTGTDHLLHYTHFSVCLSKSRRFPFFTATNINGKLFKKIPRDTIFPGGNDVWSEDDRAKGNQWGQHLYSAKTGAFQRGHMTKREDPQWGSTEEIAKNAAKGTFHFTNCVPQVDLLNTQDWAHLESYILDKETAKDKLSVSVFTGPVLDKDDPFFVEKVDNTDVRIPTHFWKVVYFTNDGEHLSKVGFLMGQENLLAKKGIVKTTRTESILENLVEEKDHFMNFEDAATYQVNMSVIEKLSGLKFHAAKEPYKDTRPAKLILQKVDIKEKGKNEYAFLAESKITEGEGFLYAYKGMVLK